jgi:hypothetical protein
MLGSSSGRPLPDAVISESSTSAFVSLSPRLPFCSSGRGPDLFASRSAARVDCYRRGQSYPQDNSDPSPECDSRLSPQVVGNAQFQCCCSSIVCHICREQEWDENGGHRQRPTRRASTMTQSLKAIKFESVISIIGFVGRFGVGKSILEALTRVRTVRLQRRD